MYSIKMTVLHIASVALVVTCAYGALLRGRVVGGSDAPDGAFPYQVSLEKNGTHHCGGSILNENWIITAAHCVAGQSAEIFTVMVGSNKRSVKGRVYDVKRVITHEDYKLFPNINDIALVRVTSPIEFSATIQPITLPSEDIGTGQELIVTGWGSTSFPGEFSDTLQVLHLISVSNEDCNQALTMGKVIETHLCTFTRKGEGACHGDSGGPLVQNNILEGIVSWGRPCGIGEPDVFTRVHSFLNWIKANQHWK